MHGNTPSMAPCTTACRPAFTHQPPVEDTVGMRNPVWHLSRSKKPKLSESGKRQPGMLHKSYYLVQGSLVGTEDSTFDNLLGCLHTEANLLAARPQCRHPERRQRYGHQSPKFS